MTDISLELDGMADLQETFEDLKDAGTTEATYVVGTNVEYGVYLEFGTEDMPPYSWFRPAIREFKANPESFLLSNTDFSTVDDIDTAEELVSAVAFALQSRMEDNVSANTATDRSPGTHPEHPSRDTGTLVNSILATRIR